MSHLYSFFLSLYKIDKLELYMNSRYWWKTIKLSKLTSSLYNFSNNSSKSKKSGIKTTYSAENACWQVITWLRKTCEARDSRHVATWHVTTQTQTACWHVRHGSTQGTLGREHVSTQDTVAHEHVITKDTVACEHIFGT